MWPVHIMGKGEAGVFGRTQMIWSHLNYLKYIWTFTKFVFGEMHNPIFPFYSACI